MAILITTYRNAGHTSPSDSRWHYTVELEGGTSGTAHVYADGTGTIQSGSVRTAVK